MAQGIQLIFMLAVKSLKVCTIMCSFGQQHIKFQPKKYRRVISYDTKTYPGFEDKLTFCLKNDMKNLMNFDMSSGKSKNSNFDGMLLWKVCNV